MSDAARERADGLEPPCPVEFGFELKPLERGSAALNGVLHDLSGHPYYAGTAARPWCRCLQAVEDEQTGALVAEPQHDAAPIAIAGGEEHLA